MLLSTVGASQAPPAATPPKLILVISIDQMRSDFVDRFAPLYRSGLKTLIDRGAVFSNAKYRHAANETGPGHSVLLTGSDPLHSGIVANDWWDPYLGRIVNVIDDPVQTPLGGSGRASSPANLLTFTVGDVMKSRNPRTRVVGVGMKDRSAILMAGRRGDAAYWFENAGGNFITSTYYMDAAPAWLNDWNRQRHVDKFAGQTWNRLIDDAALYEKYAGKDAIEGERDRIDITFPHPIVAKPPQTQYYVELRRSPFAEEVLLDFALEAMKQHDLGRDADTDILAIGFAATDAIGHQWGPDSHEQMDQMLRLDRVLGRLFEQIESSVGLDNTIVVLSADHGSRPLVEILQMRGLPGRRVTPKEMENVLVGRAGEEISGRHGSRQLLRDRRVSQRRCGAPSQPQLERGGSDGHRGAAFNGRRRKGVHARRSAKHRAQFRSVSRIVQKSVLRAARASFECAAQAGGLRELGGRRHRARHGLRRRSPRAGYLHGARHQAGTIYAGKRARGHRAHARAPAAARVSTRTARFASASGDVSATP